MIAPMTTSTASQWPASMTVTMGFVPRKAWFVAVVVSTKPNPDEEGADDAAANVDVRQMAHQPSEHPGHQEAPDGSDDEGKRRRLVVFPPLAERVLPDVAEGGVPFPAHEESSDSGNNDSEIVDRTALILSPPMLASRLVLKPGQTANDTPFLG